MIVLDGIVAVWALPVVCNCFDEATVVVVVGGVVSEVIAVVFVVVSILVVALCVLV